MIATSLDVKRLQFMREPYLCLTYFGNEIKKGEEKEPSHFTNCKLMVFDCGGLCYSDHQTMSMI